jgi:hypothetical protein
VDVPIGVTGRALLALSLLTGCYGGRGEAGDAGQTGATGSDGSDGDGSGGSDDADSGAAADECAGLGAGLGPMRRLTAPQYDNTVRDLFDGAITPGPQFPTSEIHEEYSNNPAANIVSLSAAEDIMLAAEHAAEQVVDGIDGVVDCGAMAEAACADAFVADFGTRAFRRPLRATEHELLMSIYAAGAADEGFADGIGTVVATVLQSPQFLYLVEEGTEEVEPGVLALSDHELAARISYLVWDSMPDEALRAAADEGRLTDPDEIEAQVRRLLADTSRSGPALDRFFREWVHFDGVPAFEKDATEFPQYDDVLAAAMDEELSRFVAGVLASDTPTLDQLLTSPATEVDATMAAFYGLSDAPAAGQWTPVDLPAAQRGGLLSRPALLAEHSTQTSSAPIFRGRLVRTQLLCDEIPPPPADAMANAPEYPPGATERERTEILMNHMNCGACHALMNPIGLGFEHYDPIGTWRDLDIDGQPVDASGEIVSGDDEVAGVFDGVGELSGRLAASEGVQSCFVQQMYRHTLGLESKQVLDCAVDPLVTAFADSGGDIEVLIVEMTRSNAFRMRVVQEAE